MLPSWSRSPSVVARERAGRGDRDAAIAVMRQAVDELHQAGRLGHGVWGTGVLVETLLDRGADGDIAEAQQAFDRLANLAADHDSAVLDITLLRLRALLARARGDDAGYADLRDRYRVMAKSLGFEGHTAWAEAMADGGRIVGQECVKRDRARRPWLSRCGTAHFDAGPQARKLARTVTNRGRRRQTRRRPTSYCRSTTKRLTTMRPRSLRRWPPSSAGGGGPGVEWSPSSWWDRSRSWWPTPSESRTTGRGFTG